jgi:methionyl-tRNA synthetase
MISKKTINQRYLITSALPYINGVKHLGNLIGSILPADIYAKFLRQSGEEVLFICGTDEHGTPAEIAAQENGKDIEQYCSEVHTIQKDIYEKFNIEFDYFGRSSSPSNCDLTQQIFLKLKDSNSIYEETINQYYSIDDKRYLPDRYVYGQCPHCGFLKARGDQCDGCSTLLDPEDLLNPHSSISGSSNLEIRETKHLFLNLANHEKTICEWVESQDEWPEMVRGIAKKWISEGLKSRCITRDLEWGIKVPQKGYENKVFYVWFDAPNAYISITKDWALELGCPEKWKDWWLSDSVHYTQFMAKDNIPFHSIFWPAVLFASDLGFKQVDYIKGFHWLTYENGKFSTSQKRGVFTDAALKLYPADYWRYYLISHCPETSDSDFSFSLFASVVNKDLANILGNFLNRTFALFEKFYNSSVPMTLDESQIDHDLLNKASCLVNNIGHNLNSLKFRNVAQTLRSLWVLGNEYITVKEPWVTYKQDQELTAITLVHCIHLLRLFAIVSYPFIPASSIKILSLLNDCQFEKIKSTPFKEGLNFHYFVKGHNIQKPMILFERIEDSRVEELTLEFSGKIV